MAFPRRVLIAALFLWTLASGSAVYAGPINILDQTFRIHGSAGIDFPTVVDESSSMPISAWLSGDFGETFVFADGLIDPSTGFLSAGVAVLGWGGASASSSLDFEIATPGSIELDVSGGQLGTAISGIRFTDLTNQLVLLNHPIWGSPEVSPFLFSLDPSTHYRLEAWAEVPNPDASNSRVDFVVTVPEAPSSLLLLALSLGSLAMIRRTAAQTVRRH